MRPSAAAGIRALVVGIVLSLTSSIVAEGVEPAASRPPQDRDLRPVIVPTDRLPAAPTGTLVPGPGLLAAGLLPGAPGRTLEEVAAPGRLGSEPTPAPTPEPTPRPTPRPTVAPLPPMTTAADGAGGWRFDPNVSWYGPGFYGKRTACGLALTKTLVGVAHRSLPCGTLVQFRYGGIVVTAPVVDRGPYVAGRQWDLTGGLAVRLGHVFTGPLDWRFAP